MKMNKWRDEDKIQFNHTGVRRPMLSTDASVRFFFLQRSNRAVVISGGSRERAIRDHCHSQRFALTKIRRPLPVKKVIWQLGASGKNKNALWGLEPEKVKKSSDGATLDLFICIFITSEFDISGVMSRSTTLINWRKLGSEWILGVFKWGVGVFRTCYSQLWLPWHERWGRLKTMTRLFQQQKNISAPLTGLISLKIRSSKHLRLKDY